MLTTLDSAGRESGQDSEKIGASEGYSPAGQRRKRVRAGQGENRSKRGVLTDWTAQKESHDSAWRESEQARGTHGLDSAERRSGQVREKMRASEGYSRAGQRRKRDRSELGENRASEGCSPPGQRRKRVRAGQGGNWSKRGVPTDWTAQKEGQVWTG